jgi:hypothetical protein
MRFPIDEKRCWAAAAAAALALAGCGEGDRRYEITEKRQLDEARPEQLVPADTRTRLTPPAMGGSPHGGMGTMPGAGAGAAPSFAFDLPSGWKELPAAQFRSPNFAVPGREKLECYVSVLPGGGGGITANVNRWRKQMGLADVSDADVAALPRVKFLGGDAPFVEIDGTYKGAGAQSGSAGYTMTAVAADRGGATVTAKLVGPSADVRAEADRFKAMCASLRAAAPAAGAGDGGGAAGEPEPSLTWKAPQGWTQGGPKQMRLVTFTPDGKPGVECYVALLGGKAGGLEANVNRWRQQLSLAPLSADAIAALPTVQVLGRAAPLVEVDGGKLGMYGLVCELGEQTVFVKMTGPMDSLRAEKDRFVEFCKSLGQP